MKILIVDDHEEDCYMLEVLLRGQGYEVISATDGVEALEKALHDDFDMIISDILMPRMDGFQLCREVKTNEKLKKLAFVFYTATYTDLKDEEFALSLGAEKFIVKPTEPDILIEILKEVIRSYKTGTFVAPKPPGEEEAVYLKEYNERLIKKLEDKMLQLESVNKELGESERKYKDLIDNANDAVIVIERTGYISFVNPKFYEMMGYSTEEAKKLHFSKLVHPDDLDMVTEYFRKRLAGEKSLEEFEVKVTTRTGETIYVDYNSSTIEKEGKIVGVMSIIRDITERKRAEEELRESKQRLELALRGADLGLWDWNVQTGEVAFSQRWVEMLGYSLKEIEPHVHSWEKLIHPDDMPGVMETLTAHLEGKTPFYETEHRLLAKSGEWKWVLDRGKVLEWSKDGKPLRAAGTHIDITKHKQAEEELKQGFERSRRAMDGIIQAMALTAEMRDPYIAGHQRRVAQLACAIAKEMGFPEEQIEGIHVAAVIHDIGKIYVPAEILSKPGQITEIEFNMIKTHPQAAYDILKIIEFPWPIAQIVIQHHERMDGSGYPSGLSGEEILLEARILGVADVVEAMASHRPYRPALGTNRALEEISQNRGVLYDNEITDVCLNLFAEKGFEFE